MEPLKPVLCDHMGAIPVSRTLDYSFILPDTHTFESLILTRFQMITRKNGRVDEARRANRGSIRRGVTRDQNSPIDDSFLM